MGPVYFRDHFRMHEGLAEGKIPFVSTDQMREVDRAMVEDYGIVLDVRSRSSYEHDGAQIPGSVRVLPDQVLQWASGNSVDRLVVAYCT